MKEHIWFGLAFVLMLVLGVTINETTFDATDVATALYGKVVGATIDQQVNRGVKITSCDQLQGELDKMSDPKYRGYVVQTREKTLYGTLVCSVINVTDPLDTAAVEL